MLAPGVVYGRVLPRHTYLVTNGLMFAVYAMQLMWCAALRTCGWH